MSFAAEDARVIHYGARKHEPFSSNQAMLMNAQSVD
jgi:hypothetical protein